MKFTIQLLPLLISTVGASSILDASSSSSNGGLTRRQHQDHKSRKVEEHGSNRITVGLGLVGGSNTAGNSGSSFMRGFQRQKLMIDGEERPGLEVFDLIAGLSGGTLPVSMYHFSQTATTNELLDLEGDTPGYTDPTKITMADLSIAPPKKSMFSRFVADITPFLILSVIYVMTFGGFLWPTMASFAYLSHFGVSISTPMSTLKIRDEVKSKPCLSISMVGPPEDFIEWYWNIFFNAGYLKEMIISGALPLHAEVPGPNGQSINILEMNITYALEMTRKYSYQMPIYAFSTDDAFHVPAFSSEVVTLEFDAVGNKTAPDPVEFTGFVAPHDTLSTQSNPVTLELILGMATDTLQLMGAATQYILESELPGSNPITLDIPTANGDKRSMVFTDGGFNDHTGLPALLHQGARKIVLFNGPSIGLSEGLDTFREYFGLFTEPAPGFEFAASKALAHFFNNENSKGRGNTQYDKMVNNLRSLQEAGEPTITTLEEVEVIENPFFGIKGGYKVDLTIVVSVSVPLKFVELLPPGVAMPPIGQNMTTKDEHGLDRFTNEEFRDVPTILPVETGEQNYTYTFPGTNQTIELDFLPTFGYQLPIKPARMTQLMITWMVEYAWDNPLIGSDGEVKFAGFRKFFEEEMHEDENDEDPTSSGAGTFAKSSLLTYILTLVLSSFMTYLAL